MLCNVMAILQGLHCCSGSKHDKTLVTLSSMASHLLTMSTQARPSAEMRSASLQHTLSLFQSSSCARLKQATVNPQGT